MDMLRLKARISIWKSIAEAYGRDVIFLAEHKKRINNMTEKWVELYAIDRDKYDKLKKD
jgi:hypothetical protein